MLKKMYKVPVMTWHLCMSFPYSEKHRKGKKNCLLLLLHSFFCDYWQFLYVKFYIAALSPTPPPPLLNYYFIHYPTTPASLPLTNTKSLPLLMKMNCPLHSLIFLVIAPETMCNTAWCYHDEWFMCFVWELNILRQYSSDSIIIHYLHFEGMTAQTL